VPLQSLLVITLLLTLCFCPSAYRRCFNRGRGLYNKHGAVVQLVSASVMRFFAHFGRIGRIQASSYPTGSSAEGNVDNPGEVVDTHSSPSAPVASTYQLGSVNPVLPIASSAAEDAAEREAELDLARRLAALRSPSEFPSEPQSVTSHPVATVPLAKDVKDASSFSAPIVDSGFAEGSGAGVSNASGAPPPSSPATTYCDASKSGAPPSPVSSTGATGCPSRMSTCPAFASTPYTPPHRHTVSIFHSC
jgi:hypothetical protein